LADRRQKKPEFFIAHTLFAKMAMVDASQKVQGAEPRLGALSGLYSRVHQTQVELRNPRLTIQWIGVWLVLGDGCMVVLCCVVLRLNVGFGTECATLICCSREAWCEGRSGVIVVVNDSNL